MRGWRCRGIAAVLSLVAVSLPAAASAQEQVKPYLLLIFDTSESMLDGTKLADAKTAVTNIVNSQGDAVFGLMRFYEALCPPSALACPFCSGGDPTSCDEGGELLVGIEEDNQERLLEWTNGVCDYETDHFELDTRSGTPLDGSLTDARDYFAGGITNEWSVEYNGAGGTWESPILRDRARVPAVDTCRPYAIILLSDGRETCNGDPVARAQELQSLVVGGVTYDIPVWVIGFGLVGPDAELEDIALAGGQDNPGDGPGGLRAFYPQDDVDLSLALAQIVQASLLVEVCNGVDDDCDTWIDEGVTNACGTCGPLRETCNHDDDDCDGQVDEGFSYFCSLPAGHPARDLCTDPGESVCDGIDDNCNGVIDEGGVCGGCTPGTELCDGLDNDCDGATDENLQRPCGTDVGECTSGVEVCAAGVWGACSGTGASPELCNGLDDDCDGAVDGQIEVCGIDVGECHPGARRCEAGAFGPCLGELGPTEEVCDLFDNDCDGLFDESDPSAGAACGTDVGECAAGAFVCVAGQLLCDDVGPLAETCNGRDDDCDGTADEGNPGGGAPCGEPAEGECRDGVLTCVDGEVDCVGAVGPRVEICDGLDNDCDGVADDGDPEGGDRCGTDEGECEAGTVHCIGGDLVCDGEVPPVAEACNSLDDDCDGATDEGIALGESCGLDVGECTPGVQVCVDGEFECQGDTGPHDETCDGLDNDCDTDVDEDLPLGDECGTDEGVCQRGREQCLEAGIVCAGEVPAGPEVCDCLDDDCDGLVDEDPETLCGPGFVCLDCDCVAPCGPDEEFPCPPGRECIDGYCVGDLCSGVRCPQGERCSHGECLDLCLGVVCDPGLRCGGGVCKADDCFGFPGDCDGDEACVGAECVPHPCDGVTCAEYEYCRDGDCVGSCVDLECAEGQRCTDGVCEADPCAGIECSRGRVCDRDTGECRDDLCAQVTCPAGHACDPETGDCPEDPCNVTVCPAGQQCRRGLCDLPDDGGGEEPPPRTRVLATGGGGCACTAAGPASGGAGGGGGYGLFAALGLALLLARRRAGLALAIAAGIGGGCDVEPYCVDCLPDGAVIGDGAVEAGWITYDAGPDAGNEIEDAGDPDGCTPGAAERCNGQDDDCDGLIDEGIRLDSPAHCGTCDNVCIHEHTFASCVDDVCIIDRCEFGFWDLDGDPANGCEYGCTKTSDDDSVCNHLDDDCDGTVDDELDLDADPDNCGECGERCRPLNGTGECVAGECRVASCDDGWADPDGDGRCDYRCTPSGDEVCNGRDDDCDGTRDDGDPGGGADCGSDTGACSRGTERCQGGEVVCTGSVEPTPERCNGADDDCDGDTDEDDPEGGGACGSDEGECVVGRSRCLDGRLECVGGMAAELEICNARDDDCDGTIDEGNPEGGAVCGTDVGECATGLYACVGGALLCRGGQGPRLEQCNQLDDDCDGQVDESFDLDVDLENCGGCGIACAYANAFAICELGTCELFGCESGWHDRNLDDGDGCETFCQINGSEVCNGRDDDCDGETDEDIAVPANLCNANGECAGATATCEGARGWVCHYKASVDQDLAGNIIPERRCDGLDNDCDGAIDEQHPHAGSECGNGLGVCRSLGLLACDVADPTGPLVCLAPDPGPPGVETCNGLDDDCDGAVDDGITDAMVQVGPRLWIDRYESSRPGATGVDQGALVGRACSFGGVLPWTDVTWDQADEGCTLAGKHLCTLAEWETACFAATGDCSYSYDDSAGFDCSVYDGDTCNGNDYDIDGVTPGNQDGVLPTGSLAHCGSDQSAGAGLDLAFDLSGNVKEWTATDPAGGAVEYVIMGGAYNNPQGGLVCDFDFTVGPPDFHFPDVGFRCCSDTPP